EPIRTALLEGARWWNQAFEAAGYRNAFRVELMPEGADPMDVRYNVIQWVHRATRGWSYGNTVTDPRTGEIIKGHVTLGSLRVRQDYLIAEGLLRPYVRGDERAELAERMALARLRQLSAHEVGHTLGIQHNYIASTAGRASVMDYPHPLVRLGPGGVPTLADAYDGAIGAWDKEAVRFGYAHLPDGTDEGRALEDILAAARSRGLYFLSDQDARPQGSAHPQVHLWDNGAEAAAELDRVMDVRRAALARFGEAAIQAGAPLATMEEALVPLYLHHRYQVEAAVKAVGGQIYSYALRGDGQTPVRQVPAAEQWRALRSVLRTLAPEELAFPAPILAAIPARPSGVPSHRELFDKTTSPVFDAITPAASAADLVVELLLNAERASRLVQQHALDATQPGLGAVIDSLLASAERGTRSTGYGGEIGRAVERVVIDRLMGLAQSARNPQVRAVALQRLKRVAGRAARPAAADDQQAHLELIAADIGRFLERPWDPERLPRPFVMPPGAPIGEP
ncbi:MAG: zinc-dependent metalloprotease, partial [Gemmatimonadales bacterium]